MRNLIGTISIFIVVFGIVHLRYAFPLRLTLETLWFVAGGMAIIFSGLLNLVVVERGGSKITRVIALVVNAVSLAMFCFALLIINKPQVYLGAIFFLITTLAFLISIRRRYTFG